MVTYLTSGRMRQLSGDLERLHQQLVEANQELNQTKSDLEERVERRTFEISVANASLRITSYNVCYTKLLRIGGTWAYRSLSLSPGLQGVLNN